ncbi:hypothetical protein [Paenibacillus violae]|nr:hypothetical protein [Paenibacillus sp. PFR10]
MAAFYWKRTLQPGVVIVSTMNFFIFTYYADGSRISGSIYNA